MPLNFRIDHFRRAAALSWVSILLIGVFWVLLFTDGVSQHYFQSFHPIAEYNEALAKSIDGLRRSVTFDNHFIVAYTCASIFFLLGCWQLGNGVVIGFSMACYAATGILDLGEGVLYVVMGDAMRGGMPPTEGLVFFFAWAAMMKWHFAYVGMFLLTFVVPQTSIAARLLVWGGRLVILPVGVLVYTIDADLKPVMLLARFGTVVASYLLMIAVAQQQIRVLRNSAQA